MSYLSILLEKEIKQILKDKSVFVLVFILPVLLVIIYGSAIRMEVKPVRLCIASYNQTLLERTVAQEFLGSDRFKIVLVEGFVQGKSCLIAIRLRLCYTYQKILIDSCSTVTARALSV